MLVTAICMASMQVQQVSTAAAFVQYFGYCASILEHQTACTTSVCTEVCPRVLLSVPRRVADLVNDDLGARMDEHMLERLAEVRQVLGVARHLGLQ